MGVKQLRNSSTINNINTSTKQILVSAWTVETHTHTNTDTRATKLRVTDSQKERSSTERKSVREADESRQECWKQCKTIFLKNINLQSSSHVLRVFTSQQTSKEWSCSYEKARREAGRDQTNRGWEGLKANAELRSIFGRGGWGVGDLSAACLEITNWTWLTFNKLIRWLWNAATL